MAEVKSKELKEIKSLDKKAWHAEYECEAFQAKPCGLKTVVKIDDVQLFQLPKKDGGILEMFGFVCPHCEGHTFLLAEQLPQFVQNAAGARFASVAAESKRKEALSNDMSKGHCVLL